MITGDADESDDAVCTRTEVWRETNGSSAAEAALTLLLLCFSLTRSVALPAASGCRCVLSQSPLHSSLTSAALPHVFFRPHCSKQSSILLYYNLWIEMWTPNISSTKHCVAFPWHNSHARWMTRDFASAIAIIFAFTKQKVICEFRGNTLYVISFQINFLKCNWVNNARRCSSRFILDYSTSFCVDCKMITNKK